MGLVAAVGTAVTAIAGSIGVAVTATALTVGFTTIAAVGAVVGVVGQVTHNKVLSMVGLGLGAVGGIGALAAGAGLLGSGAGLLGEAPTTAAAADAASAGTIDAAAADWSGLGNAAAAGEEGLPASVGAEAGGAAADAGSIGLGDVTKGLDVAKEILPAPSDAPPDVGHATGSAGGADTSADALNAAELTKIQGAGGSLLNSTPPVAGATTAPVTSTPLVPPPAAPGTSGGFNNGQDLVGPGGVITEPPVPPDEAGAFDGFLKFANKNPVVALGALQSAGSLLSGFTNTVTPAQVSALNSQSAANDAATALVKQQTANLAAPKAVAASAPVTGAPQQLVPPPANAPQVTPAGFINQNPVRSQLLTGVAA